MVLAVVLVVLAVVLAVVLVVLAVALVVLAVLVAPFQGAPIWRAVTRTHTGMGSPTPPMPTSTPWPPGGSTSWCKGGGAL